MKTLEIKIWILCFEKHVFMYPFLFQTEGVVGQEKGTAVCPVVLIGVAPSDEISCCLTIPGITGRTRC